MFPSTNEANTRQGPIITHAIQAQLHVPWASKPDSIYCVGRPWKLERVFSPPASSERCLTLSPERPVDNESTTIHGENGYSCSSKSHAVASSSVCSRYVRCCKWNGLLHYTYILHIRTLHWLKISCANPVRIARNLSIFALILPSYTRALTMALCVLFLLPYKLLKHSTVFFLPNQSHKFGSLL